jgi:hypothetical protein
MCNVPVLARLFEVSATIRVSFSNSVDLCWYPSQDPVRQHGRGCPRSEVNAYFLKDRCVRCWLGPRLSEVFLWAMVQRLLTSIKTRMIRGQEIIRVIS